jgi:hypothetical protein
MAEGMDRAMTNLKTRLAAITARCTCMACCRCCEQRVLLVQALTRAVAAMEKARRESASEPASPYARAATIILNEALAVIDRLAEEEG